MARTSPWPALALAAALIGLAGSAAGVQALPPAGASVDLPASAASLAAAMRLDPATPRARLLIEVIRQVHAALPDQCVECDAALHRLVEWVPAQPGPGDESDRRVPLPWSERTWRGLLGSRVASTPLALAILQDRQAALLYHGLMSTDEATRDYIEGRPKLVQRLYERLAASFAVFGRSLPVRDGVVALPGGAPALPIWEELVGERASDPEAFIPAALGKANGRFAYFLDTVVHLDSARQAFALSAWEPDRGSRASLVRALLKTFVDVQPEWRVVDRPFSRPLLDPALILLAVSARPDGRFAPPGARPFWETVFRDPPPKLPTAVAQRDLQPVDAAWIVEQTLTPDAVTGRDRLGAVCFAQRVFAQAQPSELGAVARAARAFREQRTAMIAVERLGASDPAAYARIADLAAASTDAGGPAAIAPLQAALALLQRLRERGALPRDQALGLLDSLAAVPTGDDGRYHGALTGWVDGQLLPAVGGSPSSGSPEAVLLGALAGRRADAVPGTGGGAGAGSRTVTWEGVPYEVDPAGAERARLERTRLRQAGNRLDAGLDLARGARAVADARTPAALQNACARLVAPAASLGPVPWPALGTDDRLSRPGTLISERCEDLKKVQTAGDLSDGGARQAMRELADVAEAVVTDTLVSIVYALHTGDPSGAIELAPDLARRHRFAIGDRLAERRGQTAWALPRERVAAGVPWHVEGSLVGLEHALGGLSLRLLSGQEMPAAPRLNRNERSTLALGLALMNPFVLRDAERDAMVAAMTRGRERIGSPARMAAEVDRVGEQAGWSEWRRESVRWAVTQDPAELPRLLTLADYFWAGRDSAGTAALDGWGAATTPVDGDLRLAWPAPRPWEELAGRSANGQLTTRFVDLVLRIAELLAQFRLPSGLAPAVLAPALADLIHEAPLGHADDWFALGAYVAGMPVDRMLDYIASVAAGGPLVPAADSPIAPQRP